MPPRQPPPSRAVTTRRFRSPLDVASARPLWPLYAAAQQVKASRTEWAIQSRRQRTATLCSTRQSFSSPKPRQKQ
eukprot:360578-Chlamydomonas_euryale.AAC.16